MAQLVRLSRRLSPQSRGWRSPLLSAPFSSGVGACHARGLATMARILCSDPIDPIFAQVLKSAGHQVDSCASQMLSRQELLDRIAQYQVLVVRSGTKVDRHVLEAASKLRIIGRAGTGIDNIDVVTATQRGVLVMNTPAGNSVSAAELAVGLISTVSNVGADLSQRSSQIQGKTLGIVGMGRVGREVAKRCSALGMNVIGYDPILSASSARQHGFEPVSISELFARSDYISLHVPLNSRTAQLVNKERLSLCKDGVRIVNAARAGLIDHEVLLEALNTKKVAAVAFDIVPPKAPVWDELLKLDNVLVTPHIGALTVDAQKRVAQSLSYQLKDALAGKSFKGVINAPNIDFVRREEHLPFLSLAEKLGSMQAQMLDRNKLKRILVISEGRRVTSPDLTGKLMSGVLKGLLSHMLEEEVTFENARHIAEVMGIQCVEHKHEEASASSYSDLLSVVFESEPDDGERSVTNSVKITGTVFGKNQLRLVGFNDLNMDATPSGSMLFFHNRDQPGVLHNVTSVLARNNINIGCFGLARDTNEGVAIGVLNVDDNIPDSVMEELKALEQLSDVRRINLLELGLDDLDFASALTAKDDTRDDADATAAAQGEETTDGATTKQRVQVVRIAKPLVKPSSPNFGSGPCKKRPGYSLAGISEIALGRSHRSKLGKGLLEEAIDQTKRILGLPTDYRVGIVPASDTGAMEMALWNLLGERPVDVCYWETFGKQWFGDITNELKLKNVTEIGAPFGELPDLSRTNKDHDIVFTWNGTTSGVRVPNGDWIADDRTGLTINDATSAAFAMDIPWPKIDVCTFSWQKVLGGEGGHGVLILSPRAVDRLQSFVPENRPMPKIFRLTDANQKLLEGIFEGSTINTPSMLCVEDYLDALRWAEGVGGFSELKDISMRNLRVVEEFVKANSRWIKFLAAKESIRSNTSVCLLIEGLDKAQVKEMLVLLEKEQVAFDIGSYRDAPPGLRLWCGATVEPKDLEALMPWIKWAYQEVKARHKLE